MNFYNGLMGAADIIAAIMLWLYAGNLEWLVWIVIIILLYQGFMNIMKLFT